MHRRSTARRAHPLTERECRILDSIGRDRTHKDIAAELGVSINTVANLAAKAYRKLGAHGAAAAVLAHRDAHPGVAPASISASCSSTSRRGARRRQRHYDISRDPRSTSNMTTFSVYWILHRAGFTEAEKAAPEIDQLFSQYANYRENAEERRNLTAELYKILLPHVSRARRAALAEEILRMRR